MFFDNIPNAVLIKIFSNLSPRDWDRNTQKVSRKMYTLSNSNILWRETLNGNHQNQQLGNPIGVQNKTTYINNPAARKQGYIHYDQAGRDYLNGLVDQELQNNQNLTNLQKEHLGSSLVRKLIQTEQLTTDQAIQRSSPEQVRDLNPDQKKGVKNGLTRKQVQSPNFGDHTIDAIKNHGMKFEDVKGLNKYQIKLMRKMKLTREQVSSWNSENLNYFTVAEIIKAITKHGMKFEDIKGFNKYQIKLMRKMKLTREQVSSWNSENLNCFTFDTIKEAIEEAITKHGMTFEDVKGLDKYQIRGMWKAKLTREQVQSPYFNREFESKQNTFPTPNPDFRMRFDYYDGENISIMALVPTNRRLADVIPIQTEIHEIQLPDIDDTDGEIQRFTGRNKTLKMI